MLLQLESVSSLLDIFVHLTHVFSHISTLTFPSFLVKEVRYPSYQRKSSAVVFYVLAGVSGGVYAEVVAANVVAIAVSILLCLHFPL